MRKITRYDLILMLIVTVMVGGLSGRVLAQYPMKVVDDMGVEMEIAKRPERIVTLGPSVTEILFALGLGDRIVGVDIYSDFPPEVQSKERVGSLREPSLEKLVSVKPDIVFITTISSEQVSALRQAGLTVYCVDSPNLSEIYDDITILGKITGATEAAAELVRTMQEKVAAVEEKVAQIPEGKRRKVFCEVWPDPLMTAGPGSFIHDLIGIAGGINIASDTGTAWPQFSVETLVQRDPDVIVTTFEETLKDLQNGGRAAWSSLSAVRNGRVVLVDQNLISRPGPRIVQGLEQLCRIIYPELF